jgi:hypothetical protein
MFDQLVERRIQEAQLRGVLDGLPGAGKPLRLDDLVGLGREERIEALLARSAGGVPEEVLLLRELSDLADRMAACPDPQERRRLRRRLHSKAVRLSVMFERAGRNVSARMIEARFLRTGEAVSRAQREPPVRRRAVAPGRAPSSDSDPACGSPRR